MKVLFAVNNEKVAESITRKYQEEYKEIISSKTVYYYNAIIKELQKDKTYDRIVIGEDLEPFASDNYQAIDKYIFEKMDMISDEATNLEGDNIPIILIGLDRRTKNDPLLLKLFGLGLYDVLLGQDRSIQKVCSLMYKPRSKKEAKAYYKVETENVGYQTESSNGVSESEIQNILNHYKKIGNNIPKCVQSFESINSQYSSEQIKLIIEMLPVNVKVILEENSDTYRKIMGIKGKKNIGSSKLRENDYVEKEINVGNRLSKPVIIPTTVSTKNVVKVSKDNNQNKVKSSENEIKKEDIIKKQQEKKLKERAEAEAKRKEQERIAKEKAKAEAKRKEQERIAKEKAEAEAKRKEQERIAKEKAEAEAKRKEQERIAKEKAEAEAKRKEQERIAKEKAEAEAKRKEQERIAKEKAEAEAKRKEQERIAKEKAEAEAKRKEQERIAKEKAEAEAKRKEQERIAKEKAEAEAKRKEQERIAKEKAEAEAKRKEQERIAKEKAEAEAKRKEQERIAKEKSEVEAKIKRQVKNVTNKIVDNDIVEPIKRGRGRPRKTPILVEEEVVPIKKKRGRPRKNVEDTEIELKTDNIEDDIIITRSFKSNEKTVLENDNLELDFLEEDIDKKINEESLKYDEDFDELLDFEDEEEFEELPDFEDEEEFEELPDFEDEEEFEELPDFEDEEEFEELPDFEDEEEFEELPDFEDEEEFEELPDIEDEEEFEELPDFEDEEEFEELPDFEDEEEFEELPDFEDEETDELPGFEDEDEDEETDELLGFEDEDEEIDELPGFEDEDEEIEELPGFEDEDEKTEELPGFEDEGEEIAIKQHNGSFNGINNKNYKYDNNLADSIKGLKEVEETKDYNLDTDNLITGNQKLVSFVGTTKNGTSFVINNLAEMLSNEGIKTAILDLTKNKNSYYIYTNNEEELREIAQNSFEKLTKGISEGITINKNLSVFTSLPGNDDSLDDVTNIIQTLLENYTVVLMDCDFNTDPRYFKIAQEIYLVQSLDVLTIQPLTAFLRDLKVKGILEPYKLRIVINKNIKINSLNDRILIGGMSVYNDPGMTYMTELFDKEIIKYTTIPFENQTYVKYLEGLVNCKISSKGYSKNFMASMKKLSDMVYPTLNGKKQKKLNDYSKKNKKYVDTFSKSTSTTLDKMKKKY